MRVKGRNRPSRIYTLSETLGAGKDVLDRLTPLQEAMLAAFRGKDWDRAERLIDECRQLRIPSLETDYGIYSARIDDFRADPPPEDWDGAATADSK
jgi:adenylate cyclase